MYTHIRIQVNLSVCRYRLEVASRSNWHKPSTARFGTPRAVRASLYAAPLIAHPSIRKPSILLLCYGPLWAKGLGFRVWTVYGSIDECQPSSFIQECWKFLGGPTNPS